MSEQEQIELAAEPRTVLGKQVNQLRRAGWVPAVMYGHGFDPLPLQLQAHGLKHVLAEVGGSQLIGIRVAGKDQPEMALVRSVQRDPIKGTLLHVDFYRVSMTEKLTTEVTLTLVGESPVVTLKEGLLLHGISSIEVRCLPGDLVDTIGVDISGLEMNQSLYVRDLAVPAGIEILTEPDEMIVRVVPLEAEEVLEEAPVAEAAEVEVITEAKAEEGEEAGEGEEG
jgi:large subunit ribosomal protein L25